MVLCVIKLTKIWMSGSLLNPKSKRNRCYYRLRSVASEDNVYLGSKFVFWVSQNLLAPLPRERKSRWSHEKQEVMAQKNKGGRPTKTLSEKRKYQVLLRLNTMEYYTLQGKAREASMSRTEFLRKLITKAEIKSRINPKICNSFAAFQGWQIISIR